MYRNLDVLGDANWQRVFRWSKVRRVRNCMLVGGGNI